MEFLSFLDNNYQTIEFTVNFSKDFLKVSGVLVTIQKDENGSKITTSVYSKPTNVNQYIMPNSATQSSLQRITKGAATRI